MQAHKKEPTRRARFLAGTNQVAPYKKLEQLIKPFYPKPAGAGRPPIGIARRLRLYMTQHYFGLSDKGIQVAIYDGAAVRNFVGVHSN